MDFLLVLLVVAALIFWWVKRSSNRSAVRHSFTRKQGAQQQNVERQRRRPTKKKRRKKQRSEGPGNKPAQKKQHKRSSRGKDISITVDIGSRSQNRRFTEEDAHKQSKKAWVPPGTSVEVAGHEIPGGMIYVGSEMRTPQRYRRGADPCLIDPQLDARAKRLDRSGQYLDYWPAYTDIPRSSRAAYLDWLASGRRDTEIAIGYVFLFFYGLERRILLDMEQSADARADLAPILEEIEALRAAYAEANSSFDGYSQRLLDFARLKYRSGAPAPDAAPSGSHGLGLADKVALGTFLRAGTPLPAVWALAWLRGNPHHRLNTPGTRCRDAFDQLFAERYERLTARRRALFVAREASRSTRSWT